MSVVYTCCDKDFDNIEMKNHLEQVHECQQDQAYSRQMLSHMDGSNFYSTIFQMSCKKVTFMTTVTEKREVNDPMNFGPVLKTRSSQTEK